MNSDIDMHIEKEIDSLTTDNRTNIIGATSYQLASFPRRALAFWLDIILVSLLDLFLLKVLRLEILQPILADNSFYLGLTASLYFIIFTRYYGQTLGKKIMRIKVVRKDGRALDWETVMVRELFGRIVSQLRFLYLGYLYSLISKQNQCWHDIFADTYVVMLPKEDKVQQRKKFVTIPI